MIKCRACRVAAEPVVPQKDDFPYMAALNDAKLGIDPMLCEHHKNMLATTDDPVIVSLTDDVRAFVRKHALSAEELAAVVGISLTAARTLLRGSPPTTEAVQNRILDALRANRGRSRSELRLPPREIG